jgi:hypothetical protein
MFKFVISSHLEFIYLNKIRSSRRKYKVISDVSKSALKFKNNLDYEQRNIYGSSGHFSPKLYREKHSRADIVIYYKTSMDCFSLIRVHHCECLVYNLNSLFLK